MIQISSSYDGLIQEALQKVVSPPSIRPNDIVFLQDEFSSLEIENQNDPLMITPCIHEHKIRCPLIDNGSSLNVYSIIKLLDMIN